MQDLNHDMDDLFRKAAAGYPLKTGESDWDKLSAQLLAPPVVPEVANKKNYRYYILVLIALLLFMVLGGFFYYEKPQHEIVHKANGFQLTGDSIQTGDIKKQNVSASETNPTSQKIAGQNLGGIVAVKDGINKNVRTNGQVALIKIGKNPFNNKEQPGYSGYDLAVSSAKNVDGVNHAIPETEYSLKTARVQALPLMLPYSITALPLQNTPIKVSTNGRVNKGGLYFGLNGGPEFSKIGSQTMTKTGYHAGLLAGYRFNSKISIESGVLFGRNNYYSAGKYFSMSKIAALMPAGMEIITIDGQSTQLEIPVTLKYDFHIRRQPGFFATAGLLSFVYLQEKNHYQTMLNGVENNEMGLYKDNHFAPFSQVQLSAGYEHSLGRSFRFRIEPYKKIPLKKTGMGSMPVFSSGINVALMHSF